MFTYQFNKKVETPFTIFNWTICCLLFAIDIHKRSNSRYMYDEDLLVASIVIFALVFIFSNFYLYLYIFIFVWGKLLCLPFFYFLLLSSLVKFRIKKIKSRAYTKITSEVEKNTNWAVYKVRWDSIDINICTYGSTLLSFDYNFFYVILPFLRIRLYVCVFLPRLLYIDPLMLS